MAGTIGIFICECGTNIKDALDLSAVARYAAGLPGVLFADRLGLLCSADGRAAAAAKIRESGVSLVVFAACSPKEHEPTFRQILADAGLNPFLMQIANIREQCAWSGNDRTASTGKAQRLIRAAAARVLLHEPLTQPEIVCNPDVLVIGAGVAGLTAALTLAQEQRKVYLVEKSPCIGGKVVRFGEVYPHGECAPCMLDPLMDEVLHHPRIDVITLSHVAKVLGYYGNFTATVATAARLIDEKACVGCGMCAGVCPVTVPDEYNEVLNERKAAYIPFAGALPHTAVIDREHCIYVTSKGCTACRDICPAQAVRLDGRDEVREVKAGAIVVATGFDLFDPRRAPRYGYGKVPGVYTPLEFERILNPTGPTEGTVRAAGGGAPRKIVFIHCAGSRDHRYIGHCSGICCLYALQMSSEAGKKVPAGTSRIHLVADWCLPGKDAQRFCDTVLGQKGTRVYRMKDPASVRVAARRGKPVVCFTGRDGRKQTINADIVVLATGLEGASGSEALAGILDVPVDAHRFFIEGHQKMAPAASPLKGVYIAGCAGGPRDIAGAVALGQGAAGVILSALVPGKTVKLEAATAEIDSDRCSRCKICLGLCPFGAIYEDSETKEVRIQEALCTGCGICAAACPSSAIRAKQYTDAQIGAEIEGVLDARKREGEKNAEGR